MNKIIEERILDSMGMNISEAVKQVETIAPNAQLDRER